MAFIDKNKLAQHTDLVHKSSLFQCQSCNIVLTDELEFNKHMKTHFLFQNMDKKSD